MDYALVQQANVGYVYADSLRTDFGIHAKIIKDANIKLSQ